MGTALQALLSASTDNRHLIKCSLVFTVARSEFHTCPQKTSFLMGYWSQISSQSSADVAILQGIFGNAPLGVCCFWYTCLALGNVKGSVTLFLCNIMLSEETNSYNQLILDDSLFHADACSSFLFRVFST